MPGVNYSVIRSEVRIEQVLHLLDFRPVQRAGNHVRGPCPIHGASSDRSRSFSVNLATGRFLCHSCRAHGNTLELWASVKRQSIYQATIDLCHALGREVPWIRRW